MRRLKNSTTVNTCLISNKGFSLFELLIVIAVMAVAVGFATITMAVVNNADVGKASKTFESALNTSKVQCMAKGSENGMIVITMTDGVLYYQIGDAAYPERICNKRISVTGKSANGAAVTISDGFSATISFNSAGMVYNKEDSTLTSITFDNGNRKMETILYPETGKTTSKLL